MNDVNYLIVSSTIDYSTDLICSELERRGSNYLRINRDMFNQYEIIYSFKNKTMNVTIDGIQYSITNKSLKSIFFRAPVFYRYSKELSLNDQLYRSQWGAFIRNLIIFDQAKWVNHPISIYRAENKLFQLQTAERIGMATPKTVVGNTLPECIKDDSTYIVKALDTPVFYDGQHEMFTYSTALSGDNLRKSELKDAPVIIQEQIKPKIDLRVTVVGNSVFPCRILFEGYGIDGDWRKKEKCRLTYSATKIPADLEKQISLLLSELGLTFGGVDLALRNGEYYFLEVNPTGEWGWLVRTAGFQIHKAIVDVLEEQK